MKLKQKCKILLVGACSDVFSRGDSDHGRTQVAPVVVEAVGVFVVAVVVIKGEDSCARQNACLCL